MRSDLVDLSLIKVHDTGKAILFKETENSEGVWLPKSAIEVEPTRDPRVFTVTLPEYLAIEKGLV